MSHVHAVLSTTPYFKDSLLVRKHALRFLKHVYRRAVPGLNIMYLDLFHYLL